MRHGSSRRFRSRFLTRVMVGALPVLWLVGCQDDGDLLERACRVMVEDCGVDVAVGWCIDSMGGESAQCLACIVESGCDFGGACSDSPPRCYFPRAYLPGESVDGGADHPTGRPQLDASPESAAPADAAAPDSAP